MRGLSHSSLQGPFSSHESGHSCIKDLEFPTACPPLPGNLRSFSFTDEVTYSFPLFPCFASDSENEVSLSLMEALLLLSVLPGPSPLDHLISSFLFSTFLSSRAVTLSTNTASLSYHQRPCHTKHSSILCTQCPISFSSHSNVLKSYVY